MEIPAIITHMAAIREICFGTSIFKREMDIIHSPIIIIIILKMIWIFLIANTSNNPLKNKNFHLVTAPSLELLYHTHEIKSIPFISWVNTAIDFLP